MTTYRVTWEIDIKAESATEAAEAARKIQLKPDSMATIFEVYNEHGEHETIDLLELEEEE